MNLQDIAAATASFAAVPALGAEFFGGTFRGITTLKDGTHAAVVLLADAPTERKPWADAKAWAESLGGQLPTRPVAALLYANAKDQFDPNWYWTADELRADVDEDWADSSAWNQGFGYGSQGYGVKSYAGRCRAVRLIHLNP